MCLVLRRRQPLEQHAHTINVVDEFDTRAARYQGLHLISQPLVHIFAGHGRPAASARRWLPPGLVHAASAEQRLQRLGLPEMLVCLTCR